MGRKNAISDAEWEVMRILWRLGSASANEVVGALAGVQSWDPKTIRTLLGRLIRKDVVGFEKQGRSYRYFPRLSQDAAVHVEARSFLGKIGSCGLGPMIATFIEEAVLDPETIEELRAILERKDEAK